jgi:hypothetical protein
VKGEAEPMEGIPSDAEVAGANANRREDSIPSARSGQVPPSAKQNARSRDDNADWLEA